MENLQFVKHQKDDDKSSVWQYFLTEKKGGHAKCKQCSKIIKTSGGTTSGLHTHMKTIHNINILKRDVVSTSANINVESKKQSSSNITKYFRRTNENSLDVVLARMCAYDGLPFRMFIKSEDLRKALCALCIGELPKSANTIRKIVIDYSIMIEKLFVKELAEQKLNKIGFSLTFDEWTSTKNHRYININVHSEHKVWNLGLIRMFGSMPANKCVEIVDCKLKQFELSLKKDIVCVTTDGAAVMKKVGRLISADVDQQLCFAHGIHLAVISVLYKKTSDIENEADIELEEIDWLSYSESEEEFESDEGDGSETSDDGLIIHSQAQQNEILEVNHVELAPLIKKIRTIVKIFRRSPTKNDKILQRYVKAEFNKELVLLLDCKTRWNSLLAMIERFYMLKNCILKSIIDLKLDIVFSENEFNNLFHAISALLPVKLAVEALCRKDANLISADATFKFLFEELGKLNSNISNELLSALKYRINERRSELSGVLQFLHHAFEDPDISTEGLNNVYFSFPKPTKHIITKSLMEIGKRMQLFNQHEAQERSALISDSDEGEVLEDREQECESKTMKQLLDEAISKKVNYTMSGKKSKTIHDINKLLKKEMTLFEDEGTRGIYLQKIYDLLLTIRPTSVESERVFSTAGHLCTKVRSNLKDESLNALVFLRGYFQSKKEQ